MTHIPNFTNILEEYKTTKTTHLPKKYPEAYEYIVDATKFLPPGVSSTQRLWHFWNSCFAIPKCANCTNSVKWDIVTQNYRKFCGMTCSARWSAAQKAPLHGKPPACSVPSCNKPVIWTSMGGRWRTTCSVECAENVRRNVECSESQVRLVIASLDSKFDMRTFAPKYRAEYNKIKDMTKHLPEAYQLKERIYWVRTGRDYVADQRDTHKKTKEDKLAKTNERKQRDGEKKRLAQLVKQTGRELARDARIRPVGPARCCGVCNATEVLWSSNKATFLPWCSPTCRSRHPDVEAKRLATCMEKYGDITSARNSDVKQRKNETCLARYGAITPLHDPTISENIRAHMLENYGSERAGSSPIIQAKVKSTLADKYGVSNFGEIQKVAAIAERAQKTRIDRWWPNRMENISNQITPEYEVGDYTHRTEPMPYKCVDCSTGFLSMLMDGSTPRCLTCYPLFGGRSRKEKQITEHLTSNHIKFVENTRKIIAPRELDVFIPDKSVAIEFNGLFWHSVHNYTKIDAGYHLNKTLACEAAGVQLLHVFEDEWDNKSDIVKSVINAKLGIFEVRVYARKCQVVRLTAAECNQFLAANHIQGADSSSVRLGLMYDNKLTAVMTFGKSRFNKNYEYEMYRFCTKLNTQIVGGAAKLLSHFSTEYKPTSIISYADRRYSTGGLYNALGFTLLHSSKPAYQYVKSTKGDGGNYTRRFNRTQFQKHKLSKVLAVFDPNLTEAVNMHNNGYHKIYDCGTHVFVKTFAIP